MVLSLQEALLKAGLVTQKKMAQAEAEKKASAAAARHARSARPARAPQAKTGKPEARPPARPTTQRPRYAPPPAKKVPGFIEHKDVQHIRTECDACKKSEPDVEYYEHTDKRLSAKWLCLTCADNNNIPDEKRQTMQSEHAMRKVFRRRYGKTKIFK